MVIGSFELASIPCFEGPAWYTVWWTGVFGGLFRLLCPFARAHVLRTKASNFVGEQRSVVRRNIRGREHSTALQSLASYCALGTFPKNAKSGEFCGLRSKYRFHCPCIRPLVSAAH